MVHGCSGLKDAHAELEVADTNESVDRELVRLDGQLAWAKAVQQDTVPKARHARAHDDEVDSAGVDDETGALVGWTAAPGGAEPRA